MHSTLAFFFFFSFVLHLFGFTFFMIMMAGFVRTTSWMKPVNSNNVFISLYFNSNYKTGSCEAKFVCYWAQMHFCWFQIHWNLRCYNQNFIYDENFLAFEVIKRMKFNSRKNASSAWKILKFHFTCVHPTSSSKRTHQDRCFMFLHVAVHRKTAWFNLCIYFRTKSTNNQVDVVISRKCFSFVSFLHSLILALFSTWFFFMPCSSCFFSL